MINSGGTEIGYGEGIRQAEDVDVFDEHPDFIRKEEDWGI